MRKWEIPWRNRDVEVEIDVAANNNELSSWNFARAGSEVYCTGIIDFPLGVFPFWWVTARNVTQNRSIWHEIADAKTEPRCFRKLIAHGRTMPESNQQTCAHHRKIEFRTKRDYSGHWSSFSEMEFRTNPKIPVSSKMKPPKLLLMPGSYFLKMENVQNAC